MVTSLSLKELGWYASLVFVSNQNAKQHHTHAPMSAVVTHCKHWNTSVIHRIHAHAHVHARGFSHIHTQADLNLRTYCIVCCCIVILQVQIGVIEWQPQE